MLGDEQSLKHAPVNKLDAIKRLSADGCIGTKLITPTFDGFNHAIKH